MPNFDALLSPATTRNTGDEPCVIGRTLADLPDEYRDAVTELVTVSHRDGGLTDDEVAARFRNAGLPGRGTAINKHRRGLCGCATEEVK